MHVGAQSLILRHIRTYCVELVIKPSITSNLQRLEGVLCFISALLLLKCLEEGLCDWYSVGCIKWHKGDWDTRMKDLSYEIKT
jgi:hypothetical protein